MFDFSGRDPGKDDTEKYSQWLGECLDCDLLIVGAGVTGLVAGLELQENNRDVLLITGADQPGGRLVWENGPVEILSPADELLGELGFPVDSNPPLWVDRLELLAYLVNRFYELGGLILNSALIEKYFCNKDNCFEVELLLAGQPLIATAPELIVTAPGEGKNQNSSSCPEILEKMVYNTRRSEKGFVEAGLKAYHPGRRSRFCSLVNGFVLSGRKAARLCRAEYNQTKE